MIKKVFVSLPMNGKEKKQIIDEQIKILDEIDDLITEECSIEMLDTVFDARCMKPLECLGKTIMVLAQADYVYFAEGWQNARGCVIEHECAEKYGLNIIKD